MIAAIIVSFNTKHLLKDCLTELERVDEINEVFVVDNASADGSAEMVREDFPQATLIANQENVGFAVAVNAAANLASETHLLLLNPDCVAAPSAISRLAHHLETHPRCAVVAPQVASPHGRRGAGSAGYQPTLMRILWHFSGLARLTPRVRGWQIYPLRRATSLWERVEWVSGACLLTRLSTFRAVGGLSERWFMYCEDMDYCRKITSQGYEVHHLSSVEVRHTIGASVASNPSVRTAWVENMVDYYATQLGNQNRAPITAYGLILATGLFARGLAFSLIGALRFDERYSTDGVRFRQYARAALGAASKARRVKGFSA